MELLPLLPLSSFLPPFPDLPNQSDCCKHSEELQSVKTEILSLQSALSASTEEIKLLKHHIKEAESTFSEEMNKRDARIHHLESELDWKSQEVARLVKQLHQMKIELTHISDASSVVQHVVLPTSTDHSYQLRQRKGSDVAGTYRISRRVRRATASAVTHDSDTFHDSREKQSMLTRRSLPTPTLAPSPPTSPRPPSTSPPHTVIRRASGVAHKRARPVNTTHTVPQKTSSTTTLDPVQKYKQAPSVADFLDRAQSVHVVTRPSPPVLPPIATNSVTEAAPTGTGSGVSDYVRCPPHPARHGCQRHVILARSQGLSSAPSDVRVLTGRLERNRGREEEWEGGQGEGEGGGRETAEGTLLIKEEAHHRKSQAWQELHQSGSD